MMIKIIVIYYSLFQYNLFFYKQTNNMKEKDEYNVSFTRRNINNYDNYSKTSGNTNKK